MVYLIVLDQSTHLHMFFQIVVPKNFAIFTGKHLCWSLLLIKLQAFRSTTLLQIDSNTGFFPVKFANFLRTLYFTEHIRWLHRSVMISVTAYILLTCIANFFLLAQKSRNDTISFVSYSWKCVRFDDYFLR